MLSEQNTSFFSAYARKRRSQLRAHYAASTLDKIRPTIAQTIAQILSKTEICPHTGRFRPAARLVSKTVIRR